MRSWQHDALIPPLERVEERLLDHLERHLEIILDLELAWMIELDLAHRLVIQHHLEVDLALGLVHEVEGLHFVLRKHVCLGLVMVPLEWNIVLLLRPQGVPQWLG